MTLFSSRLQEQRLDRASDRAVLDEVLNKMENLEQMIKHLLEKEGIPAPRTSFSKKVSLDNLSYQLSLDNNNCDGDNECFDTTISSTPLTKILEENE